jgi:hypothetical protein
LGRLIPSRQGQLCEQRLQEGVAEDVWGGKGEEDYSEEEGEEERLRTVASLEGTGYYHGALAWWEGDSLLSGRPPGTFLLRDSRVSRAESAEGVQQRQVEN